jgi:DNA-binding PadR family transcriptional regulator
MLQAYEPVRALCGSEARFRLLRALYENPRKAFHLRGLAAAARVDPGQVYRLLRDFVAAGLCQQIADAPFKKYQATTEHPLARALAETFAPARPVDRPEASEVDLEHAPVLRSLLWTGRKRTRIPAREAFKHYENNWLLIRDAEMGPREKRLLEQLKQDYGQGLING